MSALLIPATASSLTADSRQVTAGGVFLAYPGPQRDGRLFIADAIAKGATMVIWEREGFDWRPEWQVEQIAVNGLQSQIGLIASRFYGHPTEKLWCIGVTGTNGKTTVTHWLAQAYRHLQQQAAVIGTLGNGRLEAAGLAGLRPSHNTTPGPVELQACLAQFVAQSVDVVAMEVSSHGLDQGRVNGVAFDIAVLTNLTRDHLDYHQTMQAYQAAKRKLFDWPTLRTAVINAEDAFGATLIADLRAAGRPVLSYGIAQGDVRAVVVKQQATGFVLQIETPQGAGRVTLNALGQFNVYNALAVVATLLANDVPLLAALAAVSAVVPVPGRMQMFGGVDQPLVVVDYAHTPDALEKALHSLRAQASGKLWCVFGCGGDRDSGKRADMGRIASQLADRVVVTSDNPRSEPPQQIIDMILQGAGGDYVVEPDRASAIALAVRSAQAGDVVLVAGKGHENYQEIQGVRVAFSDADCVRSALVSGGRDA